MTISLNKTILEKRKSTVLCPESWKWNIGFYCILGFLFSCYGKHIALDYIIILAATGMLVYGIFTNMFYSAYFLIMFFEPILNMPFGGSYFRIYQVLFILSFFIRQKKSDFIIPVNDKVVMGIIFFLLSLRYVTGLEEIISMFINLTITVYCACQISKTSDNVNVFLGVISVSAVFSGIYGLINSVGMSFGYGIRYNGIINDPNYSAMFFILGIMASLGTNVIGKKCKIAFLLFLILSVFRTISLTGVTLMIFLLLLFTMVRHPRKSVLYILIALVAFLIFLNLKLEKGNILYGFQYRILELFHLSETGDYNTITSGRTDNWKNYLLLWSEQSVSVTLLGGLNTVRGAFQEYCVGKFGILTHNSMIDILFMTGVAGFLLIMGIFVYSSWLFYRDYKRSGDTAYLAVAFLKLTIFLFSLTLTMFPYRYYYAVLLI